MISSHENPASGMTASDIDSSNRTQVRIASLENELEKLTEKFEGKDKSTFKKISEWAGLIALIVAISGGGFTVYDKLFIDPNKGRDLALSQLQGIVGDLTNTNAELLQLSQQLPPDQFALIASIKNGVKLTLARRAATIIEDLGGEVDAATMLVISSEFQQFEKLDESRRLAQMALTAADNDFIRAESKRYIADATFLLGGQDNISQARATYEEGLALARKMPGLQGFSIVGNIYRDWMIAESLGDNCDRTEKLLSAMQAELITANSLIAMQTSTAQVAKFLYDRKICPSLATSFGQGQQ